MSQRFKGLAGEELPAVIFAIVLVMMFILLVLNSYTSFFLRANMAELDRSSSSIASRIYYSNSGIIADPEAALAEGGGRIFIGITDTETGEEWNSGSVEEKLVYKHLGSSSLAILLYNSTTDEYHTGRLVVSVGN